MYSDYIQFGSTLEHFDSVVDCWNVNDDQIIQKLSYLYAKTVLRRP